MAHIIWTKNVVKHWLTLVKYAKIAKINRQQLNQTAASAMVYFK